MSLMWKSVHSQIANKQDANKQTGIAQGWIVFLCWIKALHSEVNRYALPAAKDYGKFGIWALRHSPTTRNKASSFRKLPSPTAFRHLHPHPEASIPHCPYTISVNKKQWFKLVVGYMLHLDQKCKLNIFHLYLRVFGEILRLKAIPWWSW